MTRWKYFHFSWFKFPIVIRFGITFYIKFASRYFLQHTSVLIIRRWNLEKKVYIFTTISGFPMNLATNQFKSFYYQGWSSNKFRALSCNALFWKILFEINTDFSFYSFESKFTIFTYIITNSVMSITGAFPFFLFMSLFFIATAYGFRSSHLINKGDRTKKKKTIPYRNRVCYFKNFLAIHLKY